jgi:hypothetical protein
MPQQKLSLLDNISRLLSSSHPLVALIGSSKSRKSTKEQQHQQGRMQWCGSASKQCRSTYEPYHKFYICWKIRYFRFYFLSQHNQFTMRYFLKGGTVFSIIKRIVYQPIICLEVIPIRIRKNYSYPTVSGSGSTTLAEGLTSVIYGPTR